MYTAQNGSSATGRRLGAARDADAFYGDAGKTKIVRRDRNRSPNGLSEPARRRELLRGRV